MAISGKDCGNPYIEFNIIYIIRTCHGPDEGSPDHVLLLIPTPQAVTKGN